MAQSLSLHPLSRRSLLGGVALVMGVGLCGATAACGQEQPRFAYRLTDGQWRSRLTPMQYYVLRQEGTERPFTHPLNNEHRRGRFSCAGCDLPLFSSSTKFDSGTGWPSFHTPLPRAVGTTRDFTLGFPRTEVHCARCGGHLGHVFDDGPAPSGNRYCMNGAALTFAVV